MHRLFFKFGIKEYKEPLNYSAFSWQTSLNTMSAKSADIVFFGDSMIRAGNWRFYFPEKDIVNLGLSGDTIYGMRERIEMIKICAPSKVFIAGGINSITFFNTSLVLNQYVSMIEGIRKNIPDVMIIVMSVLPISRKRIRWCSNKTIMYFNGKLKEMCNHRGIAYIDTFSLYYMNGELNQQYSKDGIHIQEEAYEDWAEAIRQYI